MESGDDEGLGGRPRSIIEKLNPETRQLIALETLEAQVRVDLIFENALRRILIGSKPMVSSTRAELETHLHQLCTDHGRYILLLLYKESDGVSDAALARAGQKRAFVDRPLIPAELARLLTTQQTGKSLAKGMMSSKHKGRVARTIEACERFGLIESATGTDGRTSPLRGTKRLAEVVETALIEVRAVLLQTLIGDLEAESPTGEGDA